MLQLKLFSVLNLLTSSNLYITRSLLGAITFYTTIAFPSAWPQDFTRIARFAPFVGVLLGGGLAGLLWGLTASGMPPLTCSVLVVGCGLALTGGLHLDGAMDTADGLAVFDPEKRLEVMRDSVTGAFGAMVACIILILKVSAISELQTFWGVVYAMGWGRWGQVMAIALYPYLRQEGKGAFHKEHFRSPQDILLGLGVLLALLGVHIYLIPEQWLTLVLMNLASLLMSLAIGFWFYRCLGGHTGDSYGAVVEWTEAFVLCLFTVNS